MSHNEPAETRTWNTERSGYDVEGLCFNCHQMTRYFIDEDGTPRDTEGISHERSAGAASLDARADVQHALDALNAAMDKIKDGDSPESDLLESHATLDSLLARLNER